MPWVLPYDHPAVVRAAELAATARPRPVRGVLPEETRTRVKKTGWNAPAHVWFAGEGRTMLDDLVGVAGGGDGAVDDLTLGRARKMSPPGVFEAWRANRRLLADAAATLADDSRVIWYGPSMGAKSFLTARLMEVWAHGQDIVDALGLDRPASDRLRHVAQLGVITRNWSYVNRRMDVPEDEVRVELAAPSGAGWAWGPEGAPNAVRGSAEDFCLVVTQRRHADDTDLDIGGEAAHDWLLRAQAFAGPPTDGPDPGRF